MLNRGDKKLDNEEKSPSSPFRKLRGKTRHDEVSQSLWALACLQTPYHYWQTGLCLYSRKCVHRFRGLIRAGLVLGIVSGLVNVQYGRLTGQLLKTDCYRMCADESSRPWNQYETDRLIQENKSKSIVGILTITRAWQTKLHHILKGCKTHN